MKKLNTTVEAFLSKRSVLIEAMYGLTPLVKQVVAGVALAEWERFSVGKMESDGIVKSFTFDFYDENDGIGFECLQSGRKFELDIENGDDIEVQE